LSDEYEKRAREIISRNIDSDALVKVYEEKFNRICNEISDEKVIEALNILERLSWARHVSNSMFMELYAEIGNMDDVALSNILLPIKEKFDEQRKYIEDMK
jgi:hypothetical protein